MKKLIKTSLKVLAILLTLIIASCNSNPTKKVITIPDGKVGMIGYGSLTSKESMEIAKVELLLQLDAYDETYSQQVNSRTSYKYDVVIWGAKFSSILGNNEDHEAILNFDKFDHFDTVELPNLEIT